jgi:membrane associated rhomboid family serine protease
VLSDQTAARNPRTGSACFIVLSDTLAITVVLAEEQIAIYSLGADPCAFAARSRPAGDSHPPAQVTVFSSMFMHSGWLHLGGKPSSSILLQDNQKCAEEILTNAL